MASFTIAAAATTCSDRAAYQALSQVAGDPPLGVNPNYDAPNPNGTCLIVAGILGLILTTMITAVRF